MAKKRYVHKTVRPSDGGRLLTATAEETVGISNYVEKLNFRRELDGEIRREGWEPISANHHSIEGGTGKIDLLHEFTDHLGAPRLVASRGGSLYAYVPSVGTYYAANEPTRDATIVLNVNSNGVIVSATPTDKGFGYPSGYVSLSVVSATGQGAVLTANIVGSYIDSVTVSGTQSGYTSSDTVSITIDRYDALEGGEPYFDQTTSVSGWKEIASGLHYLDDITEGIRRWECVEVNGHAIFNNGYDLPYIYRSDWDKAYPLRGLRENKIASVGTIQVYDGRLVCADIVEITEGFDLVRQNGVYDTIYDMPEHGGDIKTRRNQYSLLWSAYGEPWLFNQSILGDIEKNSTEITLEHGDFTYGSQGSTLSVGDKVYLTGAGKNGGRLSLKHAGNATITDIIGLSSNNTFTKNEHGLKDGERIQVVGKTEGSGPIEGADYYVRYVDENNFKLTKSQTRTATANMTFDGGNTLTFEITDHGAGYSATSPPSVVVTGYTGGNTLSAVVNSIGQVVAFTSTDGTNTSSGWSPPSLSSAGSGGPEVVVSEPDAIVADIASDILGMSITKPDYVDKYRSILEEARAQVSRVNIEREVGSSAPASATMEYELKVNNNKFTLKYESDANSNATTQDFIWDSTAEDIAKLFKDAISASTAEVDAELVDGGLVLMGKIAGSAFSVTGSYTSNNAAGFDGSITSMVATESSKGGATDSELDEAYIELYGTERDPTSEVVSFNNAITITDIEGPWLQIGAEGAAIPLPVSGVSSVYTYTFVIDKDTASEVEYSLDVDFSSYWYASSSWAYELQLGVKRNIVATALTYALADAIHDDPYMSSAVKVGIYDWQEDYPFAFIGPRRDGGSVDLKSVSRQTGSLAVVTSEAQDDVWENPAQWANLVSGNTWYHHTSLGSSFFHHTGGDWAYFFHHNDPAFSQASGGWGYIGTYDDSFHYIDGIVSYKPRPRLARTIFLDAYAETSVKGSELHRSVDIAGGTVFDISLGSGYQDWQEDGTAIIKMEPIGDHLACYRENGYFITSQTGRTDQPFSFKTRYVGRNIPSFRNSVMLVSGKKHIYAGYDGIYELTLSQPQPIPSVDLAAATEFWREISETESEYVFTSNNVITSEHFIHLPDSYKSGSTVHTIALDYKYGTVSQIDASMTAACSARQPDLSINPPPNDFSEFIYIMAIPYGNADHPTYIAKYGITPPIETSPRSVIYVRKGPNEEDTLNYDSIIRFGLIAFGDTFNEKDMRSYILHASDVDASVGVEVYTAYTTAATDSEKYLFGEDNDPRVSGGESDVSSKIVLSDLKNENAIPLYLTAPMYQDRLIIDGSSTNRGIKILGRTFEVGGVYDRAAMQMVGIGGSVNVTN